MNHHFTDQQFDELYSVVKKFGESETEDGIPKTRLIYGDDAKQLGFILSRQRLFLENKSFVPVTLWNSCKIYAYLSATPSTRIRDDFVPEGLILETITNLAKINPVRSYSRLSFCQTMNFIKHGGDGRNIIDLRYLMSFLGEIRATISTLCPSDRSAIRSSLNLAQLYRQKVSSCCDELNTDAAYLLNWASVEAAKFCIVRKFSPGNVNLNDFLCFLEQDISSPIMHSNKISRKLFLDFIKNLDKFLWDRVVTSSSDKLTFRVTPDVESLYHGRALQFRLWFSKRRSAIANLAMRLDEPAECWRNASLKCWSDLSTELLQPIGGRSSLQETILGSSCGNWHNNLILLAQSAKSLGDTELLHGLISLTGPKGALFSQQTHRILVAISNNLIGHFEANYEAFKDIEDLDQDCLIEFLEACIEFNCIESHQSSIDRLESEALKQYYRLQVEMSNDYWSLEKNDSSLKRIESWLSTWVDIRADQSPSESQVIADSYVNLMIPAYLREAASESLSGARSPTLDCVQLMVASSMLSQSLLLSGNLNRKLEVYTLIIEILRGNSSQVSSIISEARDLLWNKMLCRALYDFNMIDLIRCRSENLMDEIQYRTAKYHLKRGNMRLAGSLALDLYHNSTREDTTRLASSIVSSSQCLGSKKFCWLKEQLHASMDPNLTKRLRLKFRSKSTRRLLVMSQEESLELKDQGISEEHWKSCSFANREKLLESTESCVKLISVLSTLSAQQMKLALSSMNQATINDLFGFDVKILSTLMASAEGNKRVSLECGHRILSYISHHHSLLSMNNLEKFTCHEFLENTLSLWLMLRNSIMSMIDYNHELTGPWREAMIGLAKSMVLSQPQMFIYEIVANRLELQGKMNRLTTVAESLEDQEKKEGRMEFWTHLAELVRLNHGPDSLVDDWSSILEQTEIFLIEMSRISFLRGDKLKRLITLLQHYVLMPLNKILRSLDGSCVVPLERCQLETHLSRMKSKCQELAPAIESIMERYRYDRDTVTSYDGWFNSYFEKKLHIIHSAMRNLESLEIDVKSNVDAMNYLLTEMKSICDFCHRQMMIETQMNRGILYMGMISPILTKFDLKQVLMPDFCSQPNQSRRQPIKIHKVNQTISLIVSKTSPKRLKFTGSDGVARSFLLKSQEDLRLDQLVMDVFSLINVMLVSDKEISHKMRLRDYSVTPIGSNVGLIRWIEAPSLLSLYVDWLRSRNGRAMIKTVYKKSCHSLCDKDSSHERCQPPEPFKPNDIFYQILWAKIKQLKSPLADSKPSDHNTLRYRLRLDASVFREVVMELTNLAPDELIANRLWYDSNNSHSYWLKTNRFSKSCATNSIVGYILGIGDRHPGNILLDQSTGEVIHIDYNVCFELGQSLPIAELVPFRLTPNIIRAFGFAGLEGSFSLSCCKVLDVLKSSKETLLHSIDRPNLDSMINQLDYRAVQSTSQHPGKSKQQPSSVGNDDSSLIPTKTDDELVPSTETISRKFSQISIYPRPGPSKSPMIVHPISQPSIESPGSNFHQDEDPQTTEIHPTNKIPEPRISNKSAAGIRDRISHKLSGHDHKLYYYLSPDDQNVIGPHGSLQTENMNDSAIRTEDHVKALILAAKCMINKAAMFEGWHPWV